MRYFAELAYKGTHYVGWQRQPNGMSVQQKIEESMSLILRRPITVLGCGRTDTGVHASGYFLHFDMEGEFPPKFTNRLNKVLPKDIAFRRIFPVGHDAHARFDAFRRSYEYHMVLDKNPFLRETAYHYPYVEPLDFDKMQAAAAVLMDYGEFAPFCKTNSDAKTMKCLMHRSEWEHRTERHWVYHVSANRFLRGMVRLIVGACVNAGRDKLDLAELRQALDRQRPLEKSLSMPPEGLFLTQIEYPEGIVPTWEVDS